jgi:tetratricopeptide (TPR) repeat protein
VAKKLTKKDLKQPDQFIGFWQRMSMAAGEFANAHAKALVIGISTLATVVVGSIVMTEVSEARSSRASIALDRVQRIAAAELVVGGAAPKQDGVPHFGTDKERLEAALKELDAHFSSGRGPLSGEALLLRAGLLLNLDRADEAAAIYQKLLDGKLDQRLRFLAREGLGYSYERKGKLQEAAAVFAKLGDDAGGMGGFYKDRASYHAARLAEMQGNPGEAIRIYREVLDKNPTTSLRDEISNRLALLELK